MAHEVEAFWVQSGGYNDERMEYDVGGNTIFTVIGIDGATPSLLEQYRTQLPTFDRLITEHGIGVLLSPYKPITSAKAWTTIFTGVEPGKHKVQDFITRERLLSRSDITATFVWELLEDQGAKVAALDIPATLPPINYNCEMMEWVPSNLSITEEEMTKSTDKLLEKSLELLERKLDFFAVVFVSVDRASHLFWGTEKILDRYKQIDSVVDTLLKKVNGDFMLISDHGFQPQAKSVIEGYEGGHDLDAERCGGHSPSGLIISNFELKPKELKEVTPIIYRRFWQSK